MTDTITSNFSTWQIGESADEDILVFGTHFATPSAGRVVSERNSFRFKV